MTKRPNELVYLAAVRDDLGVFIRQAFETVYPGKTFQDNWHIDAILHVLEQSLTGKLPRLIVNVPPRSLKSFLVSVAYPAFLLAQNPTMKVMVVCYSDELARALGRDFNRVVTSTWYRGLFPRTRITKATENEVGTDQGGYRLAISVGGSLTGRGADLVIVDDPMKPEDALSDKARNGANDWYRSTLLSRLDDKQFSALILVMQRLHVNDLTGFVQASGGYHKLSLPAISTRDEEIALRNGRVHLRKVGEALHPERESLHTLQRLRDEMGPRVFVPQYQQAPEAPEGTLFKRKYFRFVDRLPNMSSCGAQFVSIDSALSTAETADYTAISWIWAVNGRFYVVHAERGRWDFDELKDRAWFYVDCHARKALPINFVIENAGSGISLLSHLRLHPKSRSELYRVHPYQTTSDKLVKAARTLPFFDSGKVVIVDRPGSNGWVEAYVNEFLSFPNGRFDDQVDSLVQLLDSRRIHALSGAPLG